MPFDPTLPVNNSPVSSSELRAQFNALKDLNDTLALQVSDLTQRLEVQEMAMNVLQAQVAGLLTQLDIEAITAANINHILELDLAINDPPEMGEVLEIRNKLNDAINALHR